MQGELKPNPSAAATGSEDFASAQGVDRSTGKEWLHKVKGCCPGVKWIAHYAILGPYDFVDIYETPDVHTAHKVSLISRADGALTAESSQAMPYDEFMKLFEAIGR